mmetsp:Transcript_4428/g.8068  ORF Transcript_4428/g.8068 Transcript_4428/m.8068 type:complete len:80 (-) Transcript_4428:57-296(-)
MCDRNEALAAVLDDSGCKPLYESLSSCLEKNNRDWRKCRKELGEFRKCYEKPVSAAKQTAHSTTTKQLKKRTTGEESKQ